MERAGDADAGTAGDLGPEGLTVIPAKGSPMRKPLLVVANEISGTASVCTINFVCGWWTLQRRHDLRRRALLTRHGGS